MNLFEKVKWYYRSRGLKALIKRILHGKQPEVSQVLGGTSTKSNILSLGTKGPVSAHALISDRFLAIQPLRVYTVPRGMPRLNLVTDSINAGSLFGGVGTAIILATMLAMKHGFKLRVVTRGETPDESGFGQVLACSGISFSENVEFCSVLASDKKAQLDIHEGDRFLTTSWWTTAAVLGSISASRIDYLLQEDERMFYPCGDDWLRCHEILNRQDIRCIINTELLYRHLVGSGLPHLKKTSIWFEPAFPARPATEAKIGETGGKRTLFFYARPNNSRNLFYRGVEVLDRIVAEGILSAERWDVVFVGNDVPRMLLGESLEPKILPAMSWGDYRDFIANVDVGFCLMCTPHPSYPPLDLAAAGALVVSNKFGLKQDLNFYSNRIICAEPTIEDLTASLCEAIARAESGDSADLAVANNFSHSWEKSFANVLNFLN